VNALPRSINALLCDFRISSFLSGESCAHENMAVMATGVMTRAYAMVYHGETADLLMWCNRQEPAMDRCRDLGGMTGVYSRDRQKGYVSGEPKKDFTTCSLKVIHMYMYTRSAIHRNVFEILRAAYPDESPVACKLFVDADIKQEDCPEFEERGRRFHALFEGDLREYLAKTIDGDFADAGKTTMVCMDSTTPTKFSKHYVLGGVMFYNLWHVGAAMRTFREYVIEKYGTPEANAQHPYFFMCTNPKFEIDGRVMSFIPDLSVYTTNRAFRMLGNCKFTKGVVLIPDGMPREVQNDWQCSLEELRAAYVQDPILADECAARGKIYSLREYDGTEPRSHSVSRVPLNRGDGTALTGRATAVDSAVMRMPRPRHESTTVLHVPSNLTGPLCAVLEVLHPMVRFAPTNVKYKVETGELLVMQASNSTYCYRAKAEHSHNASYFAVSSARGVYEQRCHTNKCQPKGRKPGESIWSIKPALRHELDKILASATCSPTRPVGLAQLMATVMDIAQKVPPDYERMDDASRKSEVKAIACFDDELDISASQEQRMWD